MDGSLGRRRCRLWATAVVLAVSCAFLSIVSWQPGSRADRVAGLVSTCLTIALVARFLRAVT